MSARNKHAAKTRRRVEREQHAEQAAEVHLAANAVLIVGALMWLAGAPIRRRPNRAERRAS